VSAGWGAFGWALRSQRMLARSRARRVSGCKGGGGSSGLQEERGAHRVSDRRSGGARMRAGRSHQLPRVGVRRPPLPGASDGCALRHQTAGESTLHRQRPSHLLSLQQPIRAHISTTASRAEPEEQPARFVPARGQCRGSAEGGAHARHHSSVSTCLLEQRGERAPRTSTVPRCWEGWLQVENRYPRGPRTAQHPHGSASGAAAAQHPERAPRQGQRRRQRQRQRRRQHKPISSLVRGAASSAL
jgi:hypothetical protein